MAEVVMLAADLAKIGFDLDTLSYPKLLSPKIDGMRAFLHGGTKLMSRNLKPVVNKYTRTILESLPHPLDGELAVGEPTDSNLLYNTLSAMKRAEGEPDFVYHVFDMMTPSYGYRQRNAALNEVVMSLRSKRIGKHLRIIPQLIVREPAEVLLWEERFLADGYEGIMLRNPDTQYRVGRCTPKEDDLWKLKRFIEGDAIVIGIEEAQQNYNAAFSDELGRTRRTSHQANKSGKGMIGAIVVQDPDWGLMRLSPGVMKHDERAGAWAKDRGLSLIGKTVHWRAFGYGIKDKPRFPRYYGEVTDK